MKKVRALDAFKLLFAYCVVGIHTQLLSVVGNAVVFDVLFSMAVPYFFICSGFFFQLKLNKQSKDQYRSSVRGYGMRLLRPYLIWGIWYFFLEIMNGVVIDGQPLVETVGMLLHRWLLSSPGGGLWYVQAILCMLVILWTMNNRRGGYACMTVALLVTSITMRVITRNFADVAQTIFPKDYYTLNFLNSGIYFMLGIELAAHMGKKPDKHVNAAWFAGALVLLQTITSLMKKGDTPVILTMLSSLLTMCVILALFLFAYHWMLPIRKETSIRLRKMSTIIYFTHFTAIYGVKIVGKLLGLTLTSGWLFAASAVLLTVMALILTMPRCNALVRKLF